MSALASIDNAVSKDIFRAYDIRGIVETDLTPDVVYLIGKALGTTLKALGESWLVIGRDGRLSGPSLFQALSEGVRSTGIHVLDIGQVPTPVMYFATHYLNISSGVIITGSHNPANYNGLKMVIRHEALWGESIQNLYHKIIQGDFVQSQTLGELKQQDITQDYLDAVCQNITLSRPLNIVIDCGNGVTGEIAPKLYERLGCTVIPLFCDIDGRFPNHHPDPGQPKNLIDLQKTVLAQKADLGIAFDGDGDRLGVVDNEGNIIWPDRQLILFARDILTRHSGATILYDVKCSRHVQLEIAKAGGVPIMSQTGHSLIKAKMRETGALLGGEMSGHVFFKERWFGFDDALYAGARLLELLSQQPSNITSQQWFQSLPDSPNTPELQIAVTETEKFSLMEQLIQSARFEDANISTVDGLRVDFQDGFGLVRSSNTSPCLVLRFEGDTLTALKRIQDQFRDLLLHLMPNTVLPF